MTSLTIRSPFQEQVWSEIKGYGEQTQERKTWFESVSYGALQAVHIVKHVVERVGHIDAEENRKAIYKQLYRHLDKQCDDDLLLEYCRAYGTIVYGITVHSDLEGSMIATIDKIARGTLQLRLGTNSNISKNVFESLWMSSIKKIFNYDCARLKTTQITGAAITTFTMAFPSFWTVGTKELISKLPSWSDEKKDIPVGISEALGSSLDSLGTTLQDVITLAGKQISELVGNRPVDQAISIALLCADRTIREINGNAPALKSFQDTISKAEAIFKYFPDALTKAAEVVLVKKV